MLYVAEDQHRPGLFCKGSRECISLIQSNPSVLQKTRFENLDVIQREGASIPDWLYGTPTLVDTHHKRIFRGTGARDYLVDITVDSVIPQDNIEYREESELSLPLHKKNEPVKSTVADTMPSTRLTEDDISRHIKERESFTAQLMRIHEPSGGAGDLNSNIRR
jgi:hypothetical protein